MGLVLKYGGRVVSAPYHSTCGGETAAPDEVWRAGQRTVPPARERSDSRHRGPVLLRHFAAVQLDPFVHGAELDAAVRAYLAGYTSVPPGGAGHVRDATVESRTPSGRVARLVLVAERGNFALRGNDIRYVLRSPGGEILNSTYFSRAGGIAPRRRLARLVVTGNGYGHGVGMCQWGAIGRARAGQSARTILATYYPGTTVRRCGLAACAAGHTFAPNLSARHR